MDESGRLALELDDMRRRIVLLERQVRRLMDEERIADAVAARIKERRAQLVAWPVKVMIALGAGAAILSLAWRVALAVAHHWH